MKKMLIILVMLNIQGCADSYDADIEMWRSAGFPERNLSYNYMHFYNEQDGYLFGTYATNDPRKETIEVYRTSDGGRNWRKISERKGFRIVRHACQYGKSVFLTTSEEGRGEKHGVYRFDTEKEEFTDSLKTGTFGGIWTYNNQVFIGTGTINNQDVILTTDMSLRPKDSIFVNTIGYEYSVFFGDDIYNITRTYSGENNFFRIKNKRSENIPLDILPQGLVKQDEEHILLMGMRPKKDRNSSDATEPIEVYRYNIKSHKTERLHHFDSYTIMKDFKFNGHVMTVLVGNMRSFFNEYDLAYSLDNGKTWSIMKLKEKSYVSPSALIGNVLYIMSGAGRIQKIIFP